VHPSRRSLRSAAWLIGLLLLLPGCMVSKSAPTATASPASATPGTAPPTAKPEKGGTLVVAMPLEPDILNFTLSNSTATLDTLSALDARMIRIRDDGTYEPQLLTDVPTLDNNGVSSDGLTWILHFRPKLEWSDSKPLDARDFFFTWKTITNSSYPAISRDGWNDIASIALSPDNLTATLSLNQPSGEILDTILAGGSESPAGFLLPQHIFEDVPVGEIARSDYGDTGHVGSGPFEIAKWSQGDQLTMQRNDHYFGDSARLDKIVLRFVPDSREVMSSLSTGELDLAVDLPETSVVDLRQIPSVNQKVTPKAGAVETLAINLNDPENLTRPNPVLSDLGVRRAMMLGFNRQKIVDEFLNGQTSVAITPLDYTPWSAPDLKPYPFDQAEARQALDVAGWTVQSDGVRAKNGVRLSFTLTGEQGDSPQAVLAQRIEKAFVMDMATIGIQVEQRSVSDDELNGDLRSGGVLANRSFDVVDLQENQRSGVAHFAWRFDSHNVPSQLDPYGGNIMGYSNLLVDSALEGQSRAIDRQSRSEFLFAAQRSIYRDLPVIPVYDHIEVDASRSYVYGLKPGSVSGLWWNVESWWINRNEAEP
jgi:peptide/nickel transport system substrate-binding protein